MMPEKREVDVLLRHDAGDEYWSASTPAVEGVLADGKTPEEAASNAIDELKTRIQVIPTVTQQLVNAPEFRLVKAVVEIDDPVEK